MNLKQLQALALVIGGFVSLQPSYIHPDEHFQSLEILAARVFGIHGTIPWEFQTETAARSFVPLLVNYGPLLYMLKILGVRGPLTILRLVRLQNYLIYIIASRWAMKKFSNTGTMNLQWCNFFIATSYLTCCFQSHSFSNSFETIVLLMVLALYNELLSDVKKSKHLIYRISCILGFLISLGTFNRITFPAFILLPSILIFWQFFRAHPRALAVMIMSSALSCCAFIIIDTSLYHSSDLVIAPIRNLLYNFDESNLQIHGLHPRYQHILINLPQIVGPGILLLDARQDSLRNATKRLLLLSIMSALFMLSIFKHQELRFLLPLGPLFFACLHPTHANKSINAVFIIKLWLAFNSILGAIYGIYHQSGVIKVLDKFYVENEPIDVHIWWKTYSPPTWMYMNKRLVVSTTKSEQGIETVNHIPFSAVNNHIVDLKGCDSSLLNTTLHSFLANSGNVKLIAPNSLANRLKDLQQSASLTLTRLDDISSHLDLDHLDFGDLSTLKPGISVYSVALTD